MVMTESWGFYVDVSVVLSLNNLVLNTNWLHPHVFLNNWLQKDFIVVSGK